MTKSFDIVVIGGGPGGYVAAIKAAQLGFNTALVEEKHLGGICLNWGCIPTKALLKSAEANYLVNHITDFGFKPLKAECDFLAVIKRSRDVAEKLTNGIKFLMKKNKVTVLDNRGVLNGPGKIRLLKEGKYQEDIAAKHIILATGARARVLPGIEPDGKQIWTYKEAMLPDKLPKSILVLGSGAIGIEFANFYNAFGVKVIVVELADRILPVEDAEISKIAEKEFIKQGLEIKTNTTIANIKKGGVELEVSLKNEKTGKTETIKVEKLISAVGIVGNVENIGLEGTKIEVDRSHIVTNEYCETGEAGVYAIGDVAGAPWLAHKASHEGIICVEKIAGKHTHPLKPENIPGCTYSNPEIASVGLTEEKAKEQGYDIKVGRFNFMGNGKAIASNKETGLIKTIFAKDTGELLGAHMIGAQVTEMIQGYVIGKTCELTEEDFKKVVFPHPTLSEMMHEAVLSADNEEIHA